MADFTNRQRPARRRLATIALLSTIGLVGLSACANGDPGTSPETPDAPGTPGATATADAAATATLRNAQGDQVGTATFTETDAGLQIAAELEGLTPGHHGFHIHDVGVCEPGSAAPDDPERTGDFLSAGGHLGSADGAHPTHQGDLPSLLVLEDGTADLVVTTDLVTITELTDGDGTALMVHSGPDNFGNIPERYAPDGPDDSTLSTGDAGDRAACGVIELAG